MSKKHETSEPTPDTNYEPKVKTFEDVCDEIGKGVKKLIDAGMGATAAGELAARIYCRDYADRSSTAM